MRLPLADIYPSDKARSVSRERLADLVKSIERLGLQTPITVRPVKRIFDGKPADRWQIVAGHHRYAAARQLAWEEIECRAFDGDETDARLWEIAENLHRSELSAVERAEQIDEWRRLTVEKGAQLAHPSGGHQPHDKGHSKTADALGITRDTVRRAERIASLPEDVRDQARAEDWSQSRLLAAARPAPKAPPIAPDPLEEEQAIEAQVKRLMAAWNAAGPDARADFLARIGER